MNTVRLTRSLGSIALAAAMLLVAAPAFAKGKTQDSTTTGQSVAIEAQTSGNLVVNGTEVWEFDPASAGRDYWVMISPSTPSPECTTKDGAKCSEALKQNPTCLDVCTTEGQSGCMAPAPGPNQTKADLAEADRCILWQGGILVAESEWTQSYVQVVGSGSARTTWECSYTFSIKPIESTKNVSEHTAYRWVGDTENGQAQIHVTGWMASLSLLMKGSNWRKYSFSLRNSDGSYRVSDTMANLYSDTDTTNPVASQTFGTRLTENPPGAKATSPGALNFLYEPQTAVNKLTDPNEARAGDARAILNNDDFTPNDDGGADGSALARADFQPFVFSAGEGAYTLKIYGTLKGNSSNATVYMSVTKNVHIRGVSQICLQ